MTRLPADIYTDQTGCQFQVNAIQCLQIRNLEVEGNKELCLIHGGPNNGLEGAGMCIYEMAERPEHVDIIGASADVQDGTESLPIGTCCTVATSATCKCCLDSRDGWFETEEDLEDPELERTVTSMQCALNFAKLCVNSLLYKKKPWDCDVVCTYFGWKPVKVIKHNMPSTMQYSKNVRYLPMRRHFKSCFLALRVHWIDE
eukprot:15354683-Ditylum_brightwellii.AAC.2